MVQVDNEYEMAYQGIVRIGRWLWYQDYFPSLVSFEMLGRIQQSCLSLLCIVDIDGSRNMFDRWFEDSERHR